MNNSLREPTLLVARILLGLLFLISGIGKVGGFDGTVGYIAAKGLPMPQVVAVLTILVELGGGLALVFGFFTRQAALALAVFTLLAAIIFHAFWAAPEAQKMMQQIHFLKNLSIVGGMLMLFVTGPGAISVDARRQGG
ncbi:MAG: DoxX family protein [Caldimonas sp.]